ncbi:uncharacterized protein METZ01_LOCUS343546 [marine metagenome]|uniref:Uncharacterized protein n=1 Tax=marine metagenome TaxID=408172 RepID=A0A382R0K3_9ZZZZ
MTQDTATIRAAIKFFIGYRFYKADNYSMGKQILLIKRIVIDK